MERLMGRFASQRVAVSLPSLRAGTLTPELMELIKKVRKTGFTIAPEAGSQRLRDVINKNISEDEIIATVRDAFRMGWRLIKLYFMIGLPTETDGDLKGIVELVRTLCNLKGPTGRRGQINASLATFIPKPHTPFQWASQIGLAEAREKLSRIQEDLRRSRVEFKWQNPEMSLLEGVWARGDRRLGRLLEAAYRRRCRFDGWGDRFNFANWLDAFHESGVDPEFYTTRVRDLSEPLPWDHIDIRVSKEFLQSEWRKALAGGLTSDCRQGECSGCGVCDFDGIEPRVRRSTDSVITREAVAPSGILTGYRKLQVSYSKLGPARFFGHLEMVNIFLRALRRTGIPLKFSEGFHPKPKVAFDNPLPTGLESENERMVISVSQDVTPATLLERLNAQLPEGLRVHACAENIEAPAAACIYQVTFVKPIQDASRISTIAADRDKVLILTSPKGTLKKIAVKDILITVCMPDAMSLEMTVCCEPGKIVRPTEILNQLFGFSAEEIATARIRKLKAVIIGQGISS
jgi:radical SAM-linked protein